MSPYWSSKDDKILIDFVRIHEALYNTKSKDYRKTKLKQKFWREIGTTLNKTDTDCFKRWCYVRDYYKRRKGKPCTVSSGEAATMRADLLSFLDSLPSSSQKNNKTNVKLEVTYDGSDTDEKIQTDNEETNITYNEKSGDTTGTICNNYNDNNSNSERVKKRKKKMLFKEQLKSCMETAQRKSSIENEDETELFFSSMAKIVKKLPSREKTQLRMQIVSLVGNAELRCISEDSRQSSDSSPIPST